MREHVFTFPTATAAIAAEQALLSAGIGVKVMPVPGSIRAGCGICLRVPPDERLLASASLAAQSIPVEAIFWADGHTFLPLDFSGQPFTDALGLRLGDVAAIIGCGGKSSLMFQLAYENRAQKVLVSTTTRIYRPPAGLYGHEISPGMPLTPGINLLHGGDAAEGKLQGPGMDVLAHYAAPDVLSLLECDGSKKLPLKGWMPYEPVVPDFATVTIGVCTLWPIGLPLSDDNTHRPEQFGQLSGLVTGDIITPEAIAAMVAQPDGLFAKAQGRKVLFINQVETEKARDTARAFVQLLPSTFTSNLAHIAMGSIFQNQIEEITPCTPPKCP